MVCCLEVALPVVLTAELRRDFATARGMGIARYTAVGTPPLFLAWNLSPHWKEESRNFPSFQRWVEEQTILHWYTGENVYCG